MEENGNRFDMRCAQILGNLSRTTGTISGIRLYLKHIYATKHFSFGAWTSRQHVIAAIDAEGKTGYAECILSVNCTEASPEQWREQVSILPGVGVGSAITVVRGQRGIWPEQLVEMLEMALIDLCGKLQHIPANHLLGLEELHEVCGVHVILSASLEEVAESAQWAKDCGKSKFIKVKLFGKEALDCAVIRTVRKICPPEETYLIGDVNCGYRPEHTDASVSEIASHLHQLRVAGLDACEDPAFLEQNEWVALQELVTPLKLIPDYPMRPSRRSIWEICAGMGAIYNIHPDSAGSIIDAVLLADRIKELGAGLMIGDDSLVGPSATIWQQLASGLGARWVEATEKRQESDFYYHCVRNLSTDSSRNPIRIDLKPGFGIDIDEEILLHNSDAMLAVMC